MTLPQEIKVKLGVPDIPPYSPRETTLFREGRKVILVILDGVSSSVFETAHMQTIRKAAAGGVQLQPLCNHNANNHRFRPYIYSYWHLSQRSWRRAALYVCRGDRSSPRPTQQL